MPAAFVGYSRFNLLKAQIVVAKSEFGSQYVVGRAMRLYGLQDCDTLFEGCY